MPMPVCVGAYFSALVRHNLVALYRVLIDCYTGFLFSAQPALMTAEPSAAVMDAIFVAPEEEGRARLLRILQDFLVSEAAKHAAKEKGMHRRKLVRHRADCHSANLKPKASTSTTVNMEELVGNTDGFAESG